VTFQTLCLDGGYCTEQHAEKAVEALREYYGDGNFIPEPSAFVEEFLPNGIIVLGSHDYSDGDEHAALVADFSAATHNQWNVENCESHYDANSDKWVVNFDEAGGSKQWRFAQAHDELSEKFLQQVMAYTASKSGYVVSMLYSEDCEEIRVSCLPPDIHQAMVGPSAELLAA